ncbi:MAG: hypothetical protein M1347_02230 [Chloroflexi bacterium]|nr:hypothetical protein [Chloroflexota bacterium]
MKKSGELICALAITAMLAACGPATATPEPFIEPDYLIEQLIPPLEAPEGAQQLGGGGGGGPNGMGVGAFFISDLTIGEVHQHYYEQLEEAGWRFISEQDSENEMITFWELSDKDGAAWSGKLEVVFSPPDFPDTYKVDVMILLPR